MTLTHIHVPYKKIAEHINFISENRLNLEIYFDSDSLDKINSDLVYGLLYKLNYNPSISIHAPFMDLSPGAVDSAIREKTIERFNQVLDIAEILRPNIIVFHSGYEKWKYALKIDTWLNKSLQTWHIINERAIKIQTKIAIENIFEEEPTNLRLLMDAINSDNFGICFDTGHFNLFSKVSLNEWINTLKKYIIELHLHDNNKEADSHYPIGDGCFDFDALFKELKDNNCLYTIEGHSPDDVLKSIQRLNKYIKTT